MPPAHALQRRFHSHSPPTRLFHSFSLRWPPRQFAAGVVIISTRLYTTRNALADIPKEYVPILQYHVSPVRFVVSFFRADAQRILPCMTRSSAGR